MPALIALLLLLGCAPAQSPFISSQPLRVHPADPALVTPTDRAAERIWRATGIRTVFHSGPSDSVVEIRYMSERELMKAGNLGGFYWPAPPTVGIRPTLGVRDEEAIVLHELLHHLAPLDSGLESEMMHTTSGLTRITDRDIDAVCYYHLCSRRVPE